MTNPKPLSEMIEESEPGLVGCDPITVLLDDYDRMKRVAIELAKSLTYYSARLHIGRAVYSSIDREVFSGGSTELEFKITLPFEDGAKARNAITRAKDIIGGGDE